MDWTVYLWFALMIFFVIIEAACPFHLVSIWFAVGALAATVIGLLDGALWLQITAFFVLSVGLLIALWPLTKKVLKPRVTATNVDAVVGTEGYITAAVDNLKAEGQVKLGGLYWSARSTTGEKIDAGTLVKVDRIEGVKAFVTPVKESVIV